MFYTVHTSLSRDNVSDSVYCFNSMLPQKRNLCPFAVVCRFTFFPLLDKIRELRIVSPGKRRLFCNLSLKLQKLSAGSWICQEEKIHYHENSSLDRLWGEFFSFTPTSRRPKNHFIESKTMASKTKSLHSWMIENTCNKEKLVIIWTAE